MLTNFSWAWGLLWSVLLYPVTCHWRNRSSHYQQVSVANSSWLGVGPCVYFLLSLSGVHLVWICSGLVHTTGASFFFFFFCFVFWQFYWYLKPNSSIGFIKCSLECRTSLFIGVYFNCISNYRCEFLQSKKSSEEIAQYIQGYEGFVHVTVIYTSQLFPIVHVLYLIISELSGWGLLFVLFSDGFCVFRPFSSLADREENKNVLLLSWNHVDLVFHAGCGWLLPPSTSLWLRPLP